MSSIKDSKLAHEGNQEVDWAARQMKVLEDIKTEFSQNKPLDGLNIGACMHVTKETANLMLTLKAAGANVALCASNPLSTKDSVAAYLAENDVEVHAIHGVSNDEFFTHLNAVLDTKPDITMDDGADLVSLLHTDRSDLPVMGICLGHQLMGLAAGLRTYKLRYGHRGANQPVVDLQSGLIHITSQNHGFAVEDPEQGMLAPHPSGACSEKGDNVLGSDFTVRYVNANDRTVEGLDLVGKPSFTVQFHPEACPGPHDAAPLFDRFSEIVEANFISNKAAKTLRGSK